MSAIFPPPPYNAFAAFSLPGARGAFMLRSMAATAPNENTVPAPPSSARHWMIKIATLTVLGLALGFAYDWASTRYYSPQRVAGFPLGMMHGALMPAALPILLTGQDLPIYAPNNEGRPYNIGYIAGINLCGTVFFGLAFWQPRNRKK